MVRKTGKNIWHLLFFALMTVLSHASLRINIRDIEGNSCQKVEVGVPFLLTVIAENIDTDQQVDGFDTWENFSIIPQGVSQKITSINGVTTKQFLFNYLVSPEQKGTCRVNPLTITTRHGDVITSDKITIEVGDTVESKPQSGQTKPYILQTVLDSKVVYQGQKVKLLLQFCSKDTFDQLQIGHSDMPFIHRVYLSPQSVRKTITIDGQEYQCDQWEMEIYPEKIGRIQIPSFQASFVPAVQHQHGFGGFMNFGFLGMNMAMTLQSNPRSLEVVALPDNKQYRDVKAIGTFDFISFDLSELKGSVGQGLVAKMSIKGEGNLEVVPAPQLDMPEGLHYYEGTSSLQRFDNGKSQKTFEWIVQSDRPGSFVIPSQKFIYFDPVHKKYASIESKSITIEITGEAIASAVLTDSKHEDIDLKKNDIAHDSVLIVTRQSFSENSDVLSMLHASQMATWLIMLCILAILFLGLFILLRKYGINFFWIQKLRYRFVFWSCYRQKDINALYKLIDILRNKYDFGLGDERLQQCFIKLGLPDQSFENWQNFMSMLSELNFAQQHSSDEKELAFSLAKQWFAIILSCCKLAKKQSVSEQSLS